MELDPKRRARILDAAATLIVANGLQCSMAAIAEQAGVATGSIYNYFKSKDEMVRGVYTQLADTIAARLIFPDAESLSPRDRIFRYIYDYIDFMWEDHDRAILFEYLSNVPLITPPELVDMFEETNEYALGLMASGRAAGLLIDIPDRTLAGYIGGGIRNTLKWRRAVPSPLTKAEKSQIALISWNTIAAPGSALRLEELPAQDLAPA
ncbi:MAG TPA: TetR/AcrR family transcriptional regulator [Ensifer sp.]|nr:TetR/AcrR family transcriptional regulator [Ensifer sp.]